MMCTQTALGVVDPPTPATPTPATPVLTHLHTTTISIIG